MASTVFVINHTSPLDPGGTASPTRGRRELLRLFINFLRGVLQGAKIATSFDIYPDGATAVAASGTITMASSSGTVGCIINGVTITVTWATSDTVSAALLVAAINASTNALVQYHVTASSVAGVTTITALKKGISGNTITLAASGTNVTASGARLTGGTGGNVAARSVTL